MRDKKLHHVVTTLTMTQHRGKEVNRQVAGLEKLNGKNTTHFLSDLDKEISREKSSRFALK